ncbi:cobalt-precorrin-3B C(17)-methyltransferase [Klebsiella pneumoniae]|uniref:Cobalt-precorrin-3B C(17)-methyltransferase n=1 Tax=Klebsiella pneumoniae TaxID=573 RepID=A0A4P0YER9_KLEPN|nr:cobalt-precorrin-3B C(17)-methyltransferase [Klebsiella pneumoniae]
MADHPRGDGFAPVDMTSLVIVGNKATYIDNGLMITPRGYAL